MGGEVRAAIQRQVEEYLVLLIGTCYIGFCTSKRTLMDFKKYNKKGLTVQHCMFEWTSNVLNLEPVPEPALGMMLCQKLSVIRFGDLQ